MKNKITRRESRELAFILLFEKSFSDKLIEDILADAVYSRELITSEFSDVLAYGAEKHLAEIDELMTEHSHKWKKSRISKVSLAILRVAIFEMLYYEDNPVSVSINEAVELCKKYGGEEDAAFVNGVLGGIYRASELEEKEKEKEKEE